MEEKENERQFQLKMKELEMQDKTHSTTLPLDPTKHFDVTKDIRLVPPFQGKEVDKYVLYFKQVAENLRWPK